MIDDSPIVIGSAGAGWKAYESKDIAEELKMSVRRCYRTSIGKLDIRNGPTGSVCVCGPRNITDEVWMR